ncbi:trichohyalin [Esox lucius]|uniref:trichohyalin n=1 Tax=Esox lucius TaxID=8010 RepID=UPI001476AD68|nr:trichohyalin [Esox lucius]
MEGNRITTAGTQTRAGSATDLQVLTHRVGLLEHSVRDNVSSFAESESVLHNRIRELEVSEKSLLQKVEELTANSILRCPSMQQRQRLDERLHALREEVRSVSQEKERGERVWRDRLQRCQALLRAKEEEMGHQSQYFERFKSQLQQKLDLARDREQSLQTRVRQLENQVLEMTGSETTNITRVNAACLNTATAANVSSVMATTSAQHRAEMDSERLPHPREEGEGEEEDREETTLWRHYAQQLQQKPGDDDDGEIEGEGEAESPGAGAKLRDFILSLQEDLRGLLGREEQGIAERRGLMEQLQEAQENVRFLSCEVEEMRTLVHTLKLTESSLTEEVEELQEENRRLCQRLSYTLREINHHSGSAELDSKLSPGSSSADPGPSLDNPSPNSPALDQASPSSVDNFGPVKLTPGLSLRDTPISAHRYGTAPRSQEDSILPLPQPDLLNLSGHLRENPGLLAPGTKSSEPAEMSRGDWCPDPGGLTSLNLDKGTSEETEALRGAYLDMGGEMDSIHDHRDLLEGTQQHTQDDLHRVTEENTRLIWKLRELGGTEACEMEQGSSPTDQKSKTGNVQENRVTTQNRIPSESREPNSTPTQDHNILALTQDDLSLYTLTQEELVLALNQENRALGRRIQELLAHIESQEGESERELAQLRQQVSLLEKESHSLEQENQEQGSLITELTRKTEDDLNTIMELRQRLSESGQRGLIQDNQGSVQSECCQQSEHTVPSKYAKQGQDTSGFANSLQGDLTAGSANSEELLVDHTVRSVCGSQKDRLTSESMGRLREERDDLIGSVRSLKEEREQVALSISSQTEEKHQLTRSLWLLKEERDQVNQLLSSLKEEKEQLSKSLCSLKDETDKMKRSLCGLKEERDLLVQSMSVFQEEKDKLSQSLCTQKDGRELNESLYRLKKERDQLKSMCSLKEEREPRTQPLHNLEQERDKLSSLCHQKDISALKQDREQTVQSIDVLREQREQLREERDQMQMDIAALRNQLLLPGWSHNQQLSGNPIGMATHIEGVASESRGAVPNMDVDDEVSQRVPALAYSCTTTDLSPSAQDQLGDKRTDVETNNLVKEMELLGVELRRSREDLEKAKSEAQEWSRELGVSEVRREEAEKKALQAASKLKKLREETEEIERENHTLRAEVGQVKSRLAGLKREETDAHSLRIKMEEKFNLLQAELKEKSVALTELSSEYMSLKREHGSGEEWSSTILSLRARYQDVRTKYDVLLRQKSQTDLDVAPLKAKLSALVRKCQQRNSVLVQMLRALRGYGHLDYSLTQEAEDLLNDPTLLDYVRTFSPAATRPENTNVLKAAATRLPECTEISAVACTAQPPLSAGESVQATGAQDRHGMDHPKIRGEPSLVPDRLDARGRRLTITPSSSDRCASPSRKLTSPEKIINLHQQLQNMLSNSSQVLPFKSSPQVKPSPPPGLGNSPGYPDPSPDDAAQPEHTPIAANPTTTPLSITEPTRTSGGGVTSDHPAGTTSITTAAVLSRTEQHSSATSKTTSPVRTPPTTKAWFVKAPTSPASLNTNPTNPGPAISLKTIAPTKMAAITTALPSSLPPVGEHCVKKPLSGYQPEQAKSTTLAKTRTKPERPADVSSVEVIRTVGQSSLMIGWERPPLDELGCSNGTFVYGYRVYVDGEFHKSVMSSACTKCILENLDLSGQVHISVQTLGSNGLYAEKVHLIYKGNQANFSTDQNPFIIDYIHVNTAAGHWTDPLSPDCRTPPAHPHRSFTQPFVAIYNYTPLRDSPNLRPGRELALTVGDTVTLLGNPRSQDFCEAEVIDRQGVLEEVPVPYQRVSPAAPKSSPERGANERPL